MPVLAEMEWHGIALDAAFLQQDDRRAEPAPGRDRERRSTRSVGYAFNLNSTQQLSKVLFETLRLDPPDRRKKTASGHFSTSADVLEELRGKHPVVDLVLENRELAKLNSTYLDALPAADQPAHRAGAHLLQPDRLGHRAAGLLRPQPAEHPHPHRAGPAGAQRLYRRARAGCCSRSIIRRSSCASWPTSPRTRPCWLPSAPGRISTPPPPRPSTACPSTRSTKDQRRHAKAINFGLIYGMSAFGLSRTTDLTLAEAENFVKAYFQTVPRASNATWTTSAALAARQGYVETLLGRRRYFPNLTQPDPTSQSAQPRGARGHQRAHPGHRRRYHEAGHDPPARRRCKRPAAGRSMLLQVHDELVLEVPEEELLADGPTGAAR